MAKKGVKISLIHFVCDGCGGQNHNRLLAAMPHHIVHSTDIEIITVYFLDKGHTENEADTHTAPTSQGEEEGSTCFITNKDILIWSLSKMLRQRNFWRFYADCIIRIIYNNDKVQTCMICSTTCFIGNPW